MKKKRTNRQVKKSPQCNGALARQAIHETGRYGKKGMPAGPGTTDRRLLDEFVATGNATIGQIAKNFGDGLQGLARVARMVRLRYWIVPGFDVGELAGVGKISCDQRHELVSKLKQLPPDTPIKQLSKPKHLTKLI